MQKCAETVASLPPEILTMGMECPGGNGSWILATVPSQYLTHQLQLVKVRY